jgi:hypothetical protein
VGMLWLVLAASGCPLRDKEIRISETGVGWVVTACTSLTRGGGGNGGPGGGGNGGPGGGPNGPGGNNSWPGQGPAGSGGFGGTGGSGNGGPGGYTPCYVQGHYDTPPNLSQQVDARLFLISPGDGRVQSASKCMRLHPCFDGGRSGISNAECMASDLNQQLDGAMPGGLGYDGLKNPEEAQLVMAFYQPTTSSEGSGDCHRIDMVACAGLAAPLSGGAYDISCASCQGGQKTTLGSDTGPCPRNQSDERSCFLQRCDELLGANGYD